MVFIVSDTNDAIIEKVKETRFVIFTPFIITAICAWFDIWFTDLEYNFLNVSKTIYTYFFPSIASVMITLIAQQKIYKSEFCSILDNRLTLSTLLLVIYGVIYIMWLSRCDMCLSIILGILSLAYIFVTWFFCLNHKLTHMKDDLKVKEEKALERIIDKQI